MQSLTLKTAELALGMYLGDHIAPTLQNSRVAGKMKRLHELIIREFKGMRRITNDQVKIANETVIAWAKQVGWDGRPRSIVTLVNFLLAVYDRKPWAGRMIDILMDIYRSFEASGQAYPACMWPAAHAADVWMEVAYGNR